jgi:hypothetical protein
MKNTMKFSLALMIIFAGVSCSAQDNKNKETSVSSSDKVEAYYFHFSSRCVTCKTVEAEAKADIENLYGGKVSFQAINLDEESGKALAEKLKVSGQTLLIVKGGTKIELTNEGFMYARSNPEKFKTIIKEKVDPLLN